MKTLVGFIVAALVVTRAVEVCAGGKKLVVVVAKGSPVSDISLANLKRCFTGEPVSAGGKTLVPFNAPANTPERAGFDQVVLGMSPEKVGEFWVDRKIRGQSGAPRSLPSPAHIAVVAAKFPGGIGYLPADRLTPDVQAVSVDGVAYTDARYELATQAVP